MKNNGKAYEELTEQVFARLMGQSNVCTKVERDVKLAGKSTTHQIDVTFEFKAGVTTYRTIVQCKDWGSAVKQEQVLAFHGVLTDIPGQPRGIIVSRSGFQEGARKVAEHHGIKLYELRPPRDADWEGLIRTIVLDFHVRSPHFEKVQFIWNEVAIVKDLAAAGLKTVNISFAGHPAECRIVSGAGDDLKWPRLLDALVPMDGPFPPRVRHDFAEPAFAVVPGSALSRLAVTAIEAELTVYDDQRQVEVNLDHLIAYCFKDVLDGSVRFLRKDGAPLHDDDHSDDGGPDESEPEDG
jgi:hypothetical protein